MGPLSLLETGETEALRGEYPCLSASLLLGAMPGPFD